VQLIYMQTRVVCACTYLNVRYADVEVFRKIGVPVIIKSCQSTCGLLEAHTQDQGWNSPNHSDVCEEEGAQISLRVHPKKHIHKKTLEQAWKAAIIVRWHT
jgi:hypothetical protein